MLAVSYARCVVVAAAFAMLVPVSHAPQFPADYPRRATLELVQHWLQDITSKLRSHTAIISVRQWFSLPAMQHLIKLPPANELSMRT